MLPTRRIAFDMVLMRPACVLVAAAMGADTQLPLQFDLDTWLLVPTDNMRVYEITHEQLINLVAAQ